MMRTALQVSGLARTLGNLKLRLEQKADEAAGQVKAVLFRLAVAAGLLFAAVVFGAFALIAGIVAFFFYLYPLYGAFPSLAIVSGSMVVIALLLALGAGLVARRKHARKPSNNTFYSDEQDEPVYRRRNSRDRAAYSSVQARASSEITESLVSLADAAEQSLRHRDGHTIGGARGVTGDAVTLVQSGDRRTMVAVLAAVGAVGWLIGRTIVHR